MTISLKWRPTQVVRERIATPFYLVQLQGPPPYFLSLNMGSLGKLIGSSESINVHHSQNFNKKALI